MGPVFWVIWFEFFLFLINYYQVNKQIGKKNYSIDQGGLCIPSCLDQIGIIMCELPKINVFMLI